jgi:hypothetical protein
MPGDVQVGGADLVALGQVRERQRHRRILHHQRTHALVKLAQGMAQQLAQMGLAPSICVRVILQHGQFS